MQAERTPPSGNARGLLRRALRAAAAIVVLAPLSACLSTPAQAAGVVVIPRPAAHTALSYFKLQARPGHAVRAGGIEVRNPGARTLHVALAAVDGQTLSTLGSGYAPPGSRAHGSTRWLRLGARTLTLGAGARAIVAISVHVPAHAAPGDYLAGVSVEALDQHDEGSVRRGLAIESVERYALGVEVQLPGRRTPLIAFTGASLQREPASLAFVLAARNGGNVILQNVRGSALITRGGRVVARTPLGPGTFLSRTSIAYPIPTPHQLPPQGTNYRVRAYLRYAGGIARLDTVLRFGRAAALRQQAYGGPRAPATASGAPPWVIASAALAALVGVLWLTAVMLRRRRNGARSPLRTLNAATAASSRSGAPLSLIALRFPAFADPAALAEVLHTRLRRSDRLCRLGDGRMLVVATDTDSATAEALALDLRCHLDRAADGGCAIARVYCPDATLGGAEMLQLIEPTGGAPRVPAPTG